MSQNFCMKADIFEIEEFDEESYLKELLKLFFVETLKCICIVQCDGILELSAANLKMS